MRGAGLPPHVRTGAAPLAAALAPEAAPTGPLNKVLEHFDGELQRLWEGQSVAA